MTAALADPLKLCTPEWKKTVADYAVFHKDAIRRLRENDNPPKVIVYHCSERTSAQDGAYLDGGRVAHAL